MKPKGITKTNPDGSRLWQSRTNHVMICTLPDGRRGIGMTEKEARKNALTKKPARTGGEAC